MAGIQGTNIVAPVVPLDTADVHPTHEALYGKGGYRTVATTVERDAITAARREAGMLVFVTADGQRYRLGTDLTTWTVDAAGASAWADITGKPSTFAPSAHASSHAAAGSDAISINASQITSGTLATSRLPASVLQTTNGDISLSYPAEEDPGYHYAISISYDGQNNRFYVTPDGFVYCSNVSAAAVTVQSLTSSGTISGNISSASLTSGTVATARLGSGTASASTYLRGDQTWAAISTYTLPAATAFALGGVIVGSGLGVSSGTASVTYGTTAGTACQGNDSRLSDARTPTSHVHAASDITTGTLATARLGSGTASASTYLRGDQTWAAISTYTLPAATTSTLGGVIVGTGLSVTSGTASVTYGTTSGTSCQGNDSRLSDARTPTSHVHAAGDITSGTIATDRLGSGTASASTYLRGDGAWSAISTYTLPAATTSTLGGVIVGTGLGVSSGTASVTYGTTAGTACQGNDSRLSDSRTPTSHTHAASEIASGTIAVARLPVVIEQTQAIGNTGATKTLSLSSGSVQTATLSASCTFTMPSATAGASITLILTQGSAYTATFTSVKWPGGTAPTITATANAIDILVFVSDGTNWYGAAQQKFS